MDKRTKYKIWNQFETIWNYLIQGVSNTISGCIEELSKLNNQK